MKRRALLSVSDKTGIADFAKGLEALGFEIISTGGTYRALREAGVQATGVEQITGMPECLDGRLKTLHPKIHGGILAARDNARHMEQMADLGIGLIDVVAVNLYPFQQTARQSGVTLETAVENIDIGGPAMLRAAAKNYRDVTAVVDPEDYQKVLEEIKRMGRVSTETNFGLAAKVFAHTADYDAAIAAYLSTKTGGGRNVLMDVPETVVNRETICTATADITCPQKTGEMFPPTLSLTYKKAQDLRYGENPHQLAALYREAASGGGNLTDAALLHGKELSFNNINDTSGALELLGAFDEPTVVACKHSVPCGVGSAETIAKAYQKAYAADPVSIFGGIVAANQPIDGETAAELGKIFLEVLLAPDYSDEALRILTKKKNLRILRLEDIARDPDRDSFDIKKVSGGILAQQKNLALLPPESMTVVTKRQPAEKEREDLLFAWKIVKFVKSNGIAIAKDKQSVGIGTGQVNRIWATRQAVEHARELLGKEALQGAALASDAFFPFADCVQAAAEAGVSAIIQPGGSVRDQESIDACDACGMAMVFTGMRHFRH